MQWFYVAGGLLDTTSFAFAPMSLLAPTSSFTIVVNTGFARLILGEKMSNMAWVGAIIIIIGAIICTIFGSKQSEQRSADELKALFTRDEYLHYQVVNCSFFVVSLILSVFLIPAFFADVDAQLEEERAATKAHANANAAAALVSTEEKGSHLPRERAGSDVPLFEKESQSGGRSCPPVAPGVEDDRVEMDSDQTLSGNDIVVDLPETLRKPIQVQLEEEETREALEAAEAINR